MRIGALTFQDQRAPGQKAWGPPTESWALIECSNMINDMILMAAGLYLKCICQMLVPLAIIDILLVTKFLQIRDGKTGSTYRVGLPNPPKITSWVDIFDPPRLFGPPNPPRLTHGLWRDGASWLTGPRVALFFQVQEYFLKKKFRFLLQIMLLLFSLIMQFNYFFLFYLSRFFIQYIFLIFKNFKVI